MKLVSLQGRVANIGPAFWWQPRHIERRAWRTRIARGGPPPVPGLLTREEARAESVFLALRRRTGLSAEAFAAEHGEPPRAEFGPAIDALVDAGLLDESPGGDLALTHRGWLLSDSVFEAFVAG